MPAKRDPGLEQDLRLSHAFLNTLSATYRGLWVFECALAQLEPDEDRDDELHKIERVLERLADWWRDFDRGVPLFRGTDRPVLDGDASKAWRLLQVAEARYRSLISELTGTADRDVLDHDEHGRHLRIAINLEIAHFQRETIRGLIRLGEVVGPSGSGEIWQQRVLGCDARIADAEDVLRRFDAAAAEPSAALIQDLLDGTLLLPAHVAQRVMDVCQVFSLYTGVFDYEDAGIPEAQCDVWAEAGFQPQIAGRWFAAGLTPGKAADWIAAGATDPLVAAGFLWRGFSPQDARPWLDRFIEGRRAVEWLAAGCDAEDAREWIAIGVRDPQLMRAALRTHSM